MIQHFQSNKNDIKKVLKELKGIINDEDFDYKTQIVLDKRKNDLEPGVYSNQNTMLLLDYNIEDIARELSLLTIDDYYETIIDVVGSELLLYVFKKKIKDYLIYIKFSIRRNKIIFLISFHVSKE